VKFVPGVASAFLFLALAGSVRAAGPSENKEMNETEREDKRVRVGAVGGLGFPRPLTIEAMTKIDRTVGLGLEYSALPKVSILGVDATMWAVSADFRVFIKKSGFFVGLLAGYQHLGAGTSTAITGRVAITGDTPFLNPRIGYLGTWSAGFTVGFEAGAQIPFNAAFSSNLPMQYSPAQDLTDVAHAFGKSVMPTVEILRMGFLL